MAERNSIAIFLTSMTIGGAERVALDLSSGLAHRGYDVDLVLVDASGELLTDVPDEVTVINLGADRVATSLLPLRRYLNAHDPDVLYSMMTEPNLIAIAAHRLSRTGTRLVISEHNVLSHRLSDNKDRLVRFGASIGYPLADHAVAVSKGVRRELLDRTLLKETAVSMIYNPVRVEQIRENASKPVQHEWFLDESTEVILAGGRHEPQKGFNTLLASFARLNGDHRRLVLFGSGPETEALREQAAALGIQERVYFPGFIEDPYRYMGAADVFVLSSTHEGFGLVLIEAMACGCPVVSTDCRSGPSEILSGGTYGRLVPVGDDRALTTAIEETLRDPHDAETLYERATDFDVSVAIASYDELFQNEIKRANER
ncbi:glycosyltransferase [Halorubrum vacuolatum]|uniref:Glycosyltransferase involved in cell wall bisynthesis n=1 Tax=Halorubrum vacuolatum TaxID=63740 RepID=A0A238UPS8_HALVU|nr:glycosyltransferase [Halorubrum vacuolatum]SNR23951.1 Glycosyltransferase involved in cell wall bisynthesis [Halorubrum vacuolatum]